MKRHVRRATTAVVLVSSTAAVLLLTVASPAGAQAPDIASWWNSANLGDPAPAPPAPPDVPDGDLLVQGSNAVPGGTLPVGAAPAGSQAVAGLSFDLPPAAVVGALTLTIDGSPPPQVSVVACRATQSFTNESNGAWTNVPSYDGTACVDGKVTGNALVFATVSKLVAANRLAVVLLPGAVDRVIFKPPTAKTLQVTKAGGLGPAAPPLGSDNGGAGPSGGGNAGPPVAPVGGNAVALPPSTGLPDGASAGPADQPPVIAGQPGAPMPAANPAVANSAATAGTGLTVGQRRLLAVLVLVLETVGFALVSRQADPGPVVPGGTGSRGNGRFRPPDRGAPGRRAFGAAAVGGVGRFRRERRGAAPQL